MDHHQFQRKSTGRDQLQWFAKRLHKSRYQNEKRHQSFLVCECIQAEKVKLPTRLSYKTTSWWIRSTSALTMIPILHSPGCQIGEREMFQE